MMVAAQTGFSWLVFVMCQWAQCGSTGVCDVSVGTVWVNWCLRCVSGHSVGQLVFVMCQWAQCGSTGVCDVPVGTVWVNWCL